MDRQLLQKKITGISREIDKPQQDFVALQSIDITLFPEIYNELSEKSAIKGELIACRMRSLVFATTKIDRTDYLATIAKEMGINLEEHNGIIQIILPCLIPKRKKHATEFIEPPLYQVLDRFITENPRKKFRECVVCICHLYDRTLPGRRIRDHNNIELRGILNIISVFFLIDDTGFLCDIYNTTGLYEMDCAQIFIMKSDMLPEWFLRYKKIAKNM